MPNYRIIVDLTQRMLYLLDNDIVIRGFPVGIGKMLTQSPVGEFTIINKQPDPGVPSVSFGWDCLNHTTEFMETMTLHPLGKRCPTAASGCTTRMC